MNVPIPLVSPGHSNYEIVFMKPASFQAAAQAMQALRKGKAVILNLTSLEPGQAQRTADFVSGGTHAIDGFQLQVGKDVFLFTPHTIQINHPQIADLAKSA